MSIYGLAEDEALFDYEKPAPVSLADKFLVPPFSVLDARSGLWQDRKRRWMRLGIKSEIGRSESLTYGGATTDPVSQKILDMGATSVFDPVLCEIAYRWFTAPGDRVLDPFAGGSVRGVVASALGRWYYGIELRGEQVEANRAQARLGTDLEPTWIEGDATRLSEALPVDNEFDLLFSCPPYADLEVYSDDPRDLSAMPYGAFLDAYRGAIRDALGYLRRDRFAAWVISDVRDKHGIYRGLVADTVRAFTDAGAGLYNDAIYLEMIASGSMRAEAPFTANRKLTRKHQHMLIFVKGDPRKAAAHAKGDDLLGGAA